MTSSAVVPQRWSRLLLTVVTLAAGVAGQYWLSVELALDRSALAWGVAALSFIVLFFLSDESRELPSPSSEGLPTNVERGLFVLVLLIGLFFVAFRIDQFPPGVNHDAAWEAMYGIRILLGERYIPYANEAWGRETFTFYLKAIALYFMGPTARAIQAPSMVAGFLTLPFFYWWARTTFGARLAMVATLFYAASGWHLIFSRTGWRSDFQPFFMVLTCCFFLRGMRRAKSIDFALAGLFLAATLNTYNASRTFIGLFVLWLPLVVFQSWKLRGFLRRYGNGLSVGIVVFIAAIAPLAWFAWTQWSIFNSRAVALSGQAELFQAIRQSFLLFNFAGNGDDFFVREPGLEFPAAVFFAFGLFWCLLKIRDERAQFLVIGFLLALVPGWISRPNMNRCIGTMPYVFFFCGLGLIFFWQQMRRLVPRVGMWIGVVLAVVSCAAAVEISYRQYLSPQRRNVWGYYPETTVVGRYIHDLVPKYAVWVGGANFPRDTITYLSYQGIGNPERRNYSWVENMSLIGRTNIVSPPGKGVAFIVPAADRGPWALTTLRERFPKHRIEELRYPATETGQLFARAMLVEEEDVRAVPIKPEWPNLPVNSQIDIQSAGRAEVDSVAADVPKATEPMGELRQPRGIAIDKDGNIFVADFGNHRIQQFSPEFKGINQWGTQGDQPGYFKEPSDVAVGPDGNIFVSDTWNQRIQVFSSDGKFLRQAMGGMFGPRGVAVGPSGSFYVSDTGNNRIVRYSAEGAKDREWGGRGTHPGALSEPVGIASDNKGNIYVCDNGNGRLEIFNPEGKIVKQFPVKGWQSGAWSEPHLTVEPSGIIWLTVPHEKEVRAYDGEGHVKRTITSVDGGFQTPIGIAYDANRKSIVISDLANRLIRLPAELK